jgi:N-acetylneuraminic acid mutarotase
MYVFGGIVGREPTACVLRFNSTQGTWSDVAPLPAARYGAAACAVGSDIYIFSGVDGGRSQATVFKYAAEANEWSTLAPMPHAAFGHSVNVLGGLVYVVGVGDSGRQVLRFDPVFGAWHTIAPTSDSRVYGASFVLGECLYAVGGPSVERYDVAKNTWRAVANMLEGRYFTSAVAIGKTGPAEEQDLFDALIAKVVRCARP